MRSQQLQTDNNDVLSVISITQVGLQFTTYITSNTNDHSEAYSCFMRLDTRHGSGITIIFKLFYTMHHLPYWKIILANHNIAIIIPNLFLKENCICLYVFK